MTTYILHGGNTTEDTPNNIEFFKLMAERVSPERKWLGCYFSRLPEITTDKFERDAARIHKHNPNARCDMAEPDRFLSQLDQADVVYMAGGLTKSLKNELLKWPDIRERLQKVPVVAGSSAGMNMLGNQYASKDKSIGTGLGLLPFNMLVHYGAPEYKEIHKHAQFQGPTLALPEAHFAIFEI